MYRKLQYKWTKKQTLGRLFDLLYVMLIECVKFCFNYVFNITIYMKKIQFINKK